MDNYIPNIKILNNTENNISLTFEGRPYYLILSLTEQSIKLQLKETNSLLNYNANIIFSDMKKEKLFSLCEDIEELKEALDKIVSKGKMILQATKDNIYKLTLFSEFLGRSFSVDIMLKEEEMLNNENVLHRIDEKLKTFPTLMEVEGMIKLYHNSLSESMKINLREEIQLQFKEYFESRLKANEEKIFKAINDFNNYSLEIDSFDSVINKMSFYKDVLMSLEDDIIGNCLKESFSSLFNVMGNEFRIHYKNMKETIKEHKSKEFNLSQTIQDLKGEILTKESNLNQAIKELKEEKSKLNTKVNNNVLSIDELNKNYNDNYKTLYKTINNLNENIKAIMLCLEESKQQNTFSNKKLVDNQNSIEEKLSNKIEENILFSEEKLKTKMTSVIIGEHKDSINSMIALPNGYIATASQDKTVKIWDLNKNILIKTLVGHTDQIYCLALLSDGNIASGSWDNTIKIWESKNDYKCINNLNGHTDCVRCLLVLKNENLVSGSWDNSTRVWDCKSYNCIKTIEGHIDYVYSLINLNDGFYASGSGDKTIKIWNTNNECVNTIKEDNPVLSLLLLPGDNILSGAYQTIKIWKCDNDYKDIQYTYTLTGHTGYSNTLYLVNNDYIISGSYDTTIKVWDIKNGYQCINTLIGHNNAISSLLILNNNRLISTSWDKTIRLWN
jgi:WD40 repeat protein